MPRLPSAEEQLYLEQLNRARANPQGEFDALIADADARIGATQAITDALRYFDVSLARFREQIADLDPAAPLAWSPALATSAETHTRLMIDADMQSHDLPGEPSLLDRVRATGYGPIRALGENVYAYAADPVTGHAGFYIDWGFGPDGIQSPAGHRISMLNPLYTEVGIGVVAETSSSTRVGPELVTQHFGATWRPEHHLMGVLLDDRDGDGAYDIGEGIENVTITAQNGDETVTTTSWGSGGYQLALGDGSWTVTYSGDGLTHSARIEMDSANLKHDLTLQSLSSPAALDLPARHGPDHRLGGAGDDTIVGGTGADTLEGAGGADRIEGNSGTDHMTGGAGDDTLLGGINHDTLLGGEGDDRLEGMPGMDSLDGGAGDDTLHGNAGADHLAGGDGRDLLQGGINHDHLLGGGGDDRLEAGNGRDTVDGGAGNDTLKGNAGPDLILCGAGNDLISGGIGVDTFRFVTGDGVDRIVDFQPGIDRLELGSGLPAEEAALLSVAQIEAGRLVLDFGGGDRLVLDGFTDLAGLEDGALLG